MILNLGVLGWRGRVCGRATSLEITPQVTIIATVLCAVMALYFLPIVAMMARGFHDADHGYSLAPFAQVFKGDFYGYVVFNTVRISAIVTLICVLLAYPVSYLMVIVRGRLLQIILFCVMLPLWMSVVVKTYAWLVTHHKARSLCRRPVCVLDIIR